ncbi:DEAD/DEAH box helicase [Ponticaulis sp.]|uniref:DEAD/DEAH box helicase n=1 Tax=Ponticaulis sp. TaxID=2020902 RepID=UPI0026070F62|nr:DEAD/DEAH box helicase [Ponticaulis sp.]MDF1682173.1 DEAD/DEAH box helicase [Ponticaulis sp.]
MTQFIDFGLAGPLTKTLEELGYTTPTPIQAQAIPMLLEGHDLLGIAQTGTGKTAAFTLPLLHMLNASQKEGQRPAKSVRGLILAPTRELAVQIADSVREYGKLLGLRSVHVLGGVPINKQIRQLEKGTDILIATPGRLEDLMQQKAVTLNHVTHLILDEADQMLDMGFIHALKRIARALPKDRQTLLFSATMPTEIEKLAQDFLRNPKKVSVAPVASTAERVNQSAYFVKQKDKAVLLARLLKDREVQRSIVFTRTKHGANRLVGQLDKANLDAVAIHGNKTQNQRQKALNAFREGQCLILVATDVAARGIDIPEVSHVFNFDLPEVPEQYVHRIGRTARAGRSGEAVSLICDQERHLHRAIERLTNVTLSTLPLPDGFTQDLKDAPAEMSTSPRDRRKAEFRQKAEGESGQRGNKGRGGRPPRGGKSGGSSSSGGQPRQSRARNGDSQGGGQNKSGGGRPRRQRSS